MTTLFTANRIKRAFKVFVSPLLLAAAGMFFPSSIDLAYAEGFSLYEWSARGVALGGATVARKPDASAVAFNPALITRLPGTHMMTGISAVRPSGTVETTDASGDKKSYSPHVKTWYVPHFYMTQQLNDRWFLGVGQFSRFGLGFEYDHDWPGRFNIYGISLETTSFNPNIAWKATDKLSLAAGAEIMYVRLDINKRKAISLKNLSASLPDLEMDSDISKADGFAYGFNLAAHYQFNDQWAAGISYRSQAKIRAEGENEFSWKNKSAYNRFPSSIQGAVGKGVQDKFKDTGARGTVILPDSYTAGIAWTPVPEFSLEVGAVYTRWSSFRSLRIHLDDESNTVSESKKQWKDVWRFNIGAEYDVNDWLTVRAGYVYDQSPMTERYSDYLVPTNGRHIMSTGLGFNFDNWTVDVAYAFIKIHDRHYKANTDPDYNVLQGRTKDADSHIVSLSFGYNF